MADIRQALWVNEVQRECLLNADGDVDSALIAADMILSAQPFPEEEIEDNNKLADSLVDELIAAVKEEDSKALSVFLAYDIYNREAQGVLNRALFAAKRLGNIARRELSDALDKDRTHVGEAILKWLEKYRVQLAKLLSTTQLASLLEGAREVAKDVPTLSDFPGAVPPPPSLEPKEALELVERLAKMSVEDRAAEIYELPQDQQVYVQQSISSREAYGAGDVGKPPPPFTPPEPPADSPEGIHFPTIDEAVKHLSEKNVLTRDKFDMLDDATRAKSFTVANVQAEETLTKIRDTLAENVKEGASYKVFKEKILDAVDEGTFMSPWHMETVFRTNVQSAFSDGQMTVLNHPLVRSGFPYARQDAIHDDRTEDTHLAVEHIGIDGTNVFRINDPVFQTFRAPWRWNCRCGWRAMTVRSAAERGIKEAQEWLETGVEPTPPAFVEMPDFQPPPGFQRAIISAPLSIRLSIESVYVFSLKEGKPEEKEETDESLLMAGGSPSNTGAGDTAREPPAGRRMTRVERRTKKLMKVIRRSKKRNRPKKRWTASPSLAIDQQGISHKGKGRPGGGQFTSRGVEDSDVGSNQPARHTQRGGPIPQPVPAGGPGTSGDVQQPDAAGAGVEGQAPEPIDTGAAKARQDPNQPIDIGTNKRARPVPKQTAEALGKLDNLGKWAQRTGNLDFGGWLVELRKHIEAFGVEGALSKMPPEPPPQEGSEEPVAYDPGRAYTEEWNSKTREYLSHHGIHSYYDVEGATSKRKGIDDEIRTFTDHLAKDGLSPIYSQRTGNIDGVQTEEGDFFDVGTPEYNERIDKVHGGWNAIDRLGKLGEEKKSLIQDQPNQSRKVISSITPKAREGSLGENKAEKEVEKFGIKIVRDPKTNEITELIDDHGEHRKVDSPEYYDLIGNNPDGQLRSAVEKLRSSSSSSGREYPEGTQVKFRPAESGLTDKLKEAKNLPGLETSEDLNTIMGKPVTHVTEELTNKLDQHYGKGQWIIKPYTEDAFAGHGIHFAENVATQRDDTKNTIYNANQQLGKLGFSITRDQNGKISGLQGPYNDSYAMGSPEYDVLIKRARNTSSLAGRLIDELPKLAESEHGIPLHNRDGDITSPKEDGTGHYMAQPAFPAVQEDVFRRKQGFAYSSTEARVHVTTEGGQAKIVPYATFYKKSDYPILFEDENSKAMHEAVMEAIMAQPESERQGHVYAPDVIRTGDPSKHRGFKVVELNPSNEVGSSGHFGNKPLIIDAFVSHIQGRDPGFVKFIKRLLTTKRGSKSLSLQVLFRMGSQPLTPPIVPPNNPPAPPPLFPGNQTITDPELLFGTAVATEIREVAVDIYPLLYDDEKSLEYAIEIYRMYKKFKIDSSLRHYAKKIISNSEMFGEAKDRELNLQKSIKDAKIGKGK